MTLKGCQQPFENLCEARPSSRGICCKFWKPHRVGEVLAKFTIDTVMFFLGEAIAPSSTRHLAGQQGERHKQPLFPYYVLRSHNLGVSRSKEIWLGICKSLHIYIRICFELSTFF